MPILIPDYKAPKWIPGAQLQTILPAKLLPRPQILYRRELIDMPDGDFMVFDWATPEPLDDKAPVLVHFHGLEGSSQSHYAQMLMYTAAQRGWRGVVAHFRGCGGLANRLPRAYFAGDSDDCEWALNAVRSRYPKAPFFAVGVSLGANQLAKFLGDRGEAASYVWGAACIGAPCDLVAGSEVLKIGANLLYSDMFLSTLKKKLEEKSKRFPGLVDYEAIQRCKTLYDFDGLYTAPIHGFSSAMDYWIKCSSKPALKNVKVPLLFMNAKNDPFQPEWALPRVDEVSPWVYLDQPEEGGHIGFPTGRFPGSLSYLPDHIMAFFDPILAQRR